MVDSIREKRKVLMKVVSKSLGVDVPSSSTTRVSEALRAETQAESLPHRVAVALSSLRDLSTGGLQSLKKAVNACLQQIESEYFDMKLPALFSSEVGGVIRSFQAVDAEKLGHAAIAAVGGGEESLEDLALLLRVGADLEGLVSGCTALMRAVSAGNVQVVEMLVRAGADLETRGGGRGNEGFTALVYGITCTAPQLRAPIIRFLVSAGANVNAQNQNGRNVLMHVVYSGSLEIFDFLLSSGADPRAETESKYPLLHNAVMGGHRAIVERVLDLGVDVELRDQYGTTPFHLTVGVSQGTQVYGHPDVAELLLSRGADVNAADDQQEGSTLIHHAASLGCPGVLTVALDSGADVHVRDHYGLTALHWCTCNRANHEGEPLDVVPERKLLCAQLLVERGVDPSAEDNAGRTALSYAEVGPEADFPLRDFLAGLQQPQVEVEEDKQEEEKEEEEEEGEEREDEEEDDGEEKGEEVEEGDEAGEQGATGAGDAVAGIDLLHQFPETKRQEILSAINRFKITGAQKFQGWSMVKAKADALYPKLKADLETFDNIPPKVMAAVLDNLDGTVSETKVYEGCNIDPKKNDSEPDSAEGNMYKLWYCVQRHENACNECPTVSVAMLVFGVSFSDLRNGRYEYVDVPVYADQKVIQTRGFLWMRQTVETVQRVQVGTETVRRPVGDGFSAEEIGKLMQWMEVQVCEEAAARSAPLPRPLTVNNAERIMDVTDADTDTNDRQSRGRSRRKRTSAAQLITLSAVLGGAATMSIVA
uniref:Uncharacterized protein n=1 Tax=Chromera velia CCMP2878 TaxID=1169474 RepID=A0A0G4FXP6_9ALVE|eukprot:Cvel_3829.t1-p1 / transcript=Cvel_3829.t1 / gene=Cvel_3829 / organism=Chromera_velia_CCMP2878 / gene_product=Ankyrin repeat and death domain-containing protein, putative / transcript_product=Ankyrin repeat and death domain-containing protein, putative / location=Cvel_scaffold162:6875-11459(-) / protein_length=762 / sequence_SO=supercontig / SO=protein_coding / is_pseudo=false